MESLSKTSDHFRRYVVSRDDGDFNFVAMDGGKFSIAKETAISRMNVLQNTSKYDLALVFHFDHACMLFLDIDNMYNQSIDSILTCVACTANEMFEVEQIESDSLIVTKNECAERYHIYVPSVIVTRQTLATFTKKVNTKIGYPCADVKCHTLRVDGFNKYDRDSKTWTPNTRYVPIDESDIDSVFFQKIWLIADDEQTTTLTRANFRFNNINQEVEEELSQRLSQLSSNAYSNDSGNANQSEEKSVESSQLYVRIEDVKSFQEACIHFEFLDECLDEEEIRKITYNDNFLFFDAEKNETGMFCPFQNRQHSKSNTYHVLNCQTGVLKQACHSSKCTGQYKFIASKNSIPEYKATEDGLAVLFCQLHPNMFSQTRIGTNCYDLYIYQPKLGIYKVDNGDAMVTLHLVGEFFEQLTYYLQIEADCIDWNDKNAVREHLHKKSQVNKLQKLSMCKNVIHFIKLHKLDDGLKLDQNPHILVTDKGAWNFLTNEIGQTTSKDLITDAQVIGVPFEPRDEAKVKFLRTELNNKFFPVVAERDCYEGHQCSSMGGGSSEKHSDVHDGGGDNGKSFHQHFLHHALGDYSHRLNSDVIQSAHPDRSSIAALHRKRNVFLEEPDVRKDINGSLLKELCSGSSEMSARRLYSANSKIRTELTLSINVNELPDIKPLDTAMMSRLRIFKWRSTFVNDPSQVNEAEYKFLANPAFNAIDFMDKNGMQYLHLWADIYRANYNNGRLIIPMADSCKLSVQQYETQQNVFMNAFNEKFELVQDKNQIVQVTDLTKVFKHSDLWQNLNKKTKVGGLRKYIESKIKANSVLKSRFKARGRVGGRSFRNGLLGVKLKEQPQNESTVPANDLDSEQLHDARDENLQVSNDSNNINSQLSIAHNNGQLPLLSGVGNPLASQASNIANNHHSQLNASNRDSHVHAYGTSDNNINVVESMDVELPNANNMAGKPEIQNKEIKQHVSQNVECDEPPRKQRRTK